MSRATQARFLERQRLNRLEERTRDLGVCCGCDKPITNSMLNAGKAIKYSSVFICNECEGGI